MSYTALYRKYRPNNFKNVYGQDIIVEVLKNSIINQHISHAYLFTGPRGTGKTSIAKIFAHAVNCENFTDDVCNTCQSCTFLAENDSDIIEIDAASNNGVDEIRTLRDNVNLLPTFCKYKIYIIDEVHMLSTGAFNALLKTLEEPPQHVIFILATTEPNKIPVTILSRCQRFDFNKIDETSLINRLKFILKEENKQMSDDVVKYIADLSDGGLRDAINLLDQALSLDNDSLTIEDIDKISGNVSKSTIFKLLDYLFSSDYKLLLSYIDELSLNGRNYNDIVNMLLIVLRDIIINKQVNDYFEKEYSSNLSKYIVEDYIIIELTKALNELLYEMKNTTDQKLLFEIYMMNIVNIINKKNDSSMSYSQKSSDIHSSINTEKKSSTIDYKENENINTSSDNNEHIQNVQETSLEDNEEKKQDDSFNIDELKKIRINNTFAGADKKILEKVSLEFDKINDFISNKVYNNLAALLIDSKIVVASSEYLLFSFKDESSVAVFDSNYKSIEIFLNEIFSNSYKISAVSNKTWENLKKEFIENKKNNIPYVKIEENVVKLKVESSNMNELENSALDIFGEENISVK